MTIDFTSFLIGAAFGAAICYFVAVLIVKATR